MKSSKFNYCIAFDCETSGMNFGTLNTASKEGQTPATDYQMVSAGFIIADAMTFKELDRLYVEIKWNGKAKWESKAEAIHGLSKEYLEEHGISEEDAAYKVAEFILKWFDPEESLVLLGQNVCTFDIFFLKEFLARHSLPFKFAHRQIDTFSISMGTVKQFDSNDLFNLMGYADRKAHNALDDAAMALGTARRINKLWNDAYGPKAG